MTEERKREDDLTIKLPFGIELSGRGKRVGGILLTAVVILAIGGYLYLHDQHMVEWESNMDRHMKAMIYVLTLSESERKQLKLDMPEELRRKRVVEP